MSDEPGRVWLHLDDKHESDQFRRNSCVAANFLLVRRMVLSMTMNNKHNSIIGISALIVGNVPSFLGGVHLWLQVLGSAVGLAIALLTLWRMLKSPKK